MLAPALAEAAAPPQGQTRAQDARRLMLRIAHLSDIHFGGENVAAVNATFDLLTASPPDLTVLSGDLTRRRGEAHEFAARPRPRSRG